MHTTETSSALSRVGASDIGAIIRGARAVARLKQGELGKLCGYSASVISRIESGKQRPDWATVRRIAEVLNIPHESLLVTAHDSSNAATSAPSQPIRLAARVPSNELQLQEGEAVRRRELFTGALGVSAALVSRPAAGAEAPASNDPTAALERVLFRPEGAPPVSLNQLRARLTAARTDFQTARYDALAAGLPPLISAAHATYEAETGVHRDQASAILARAYVLATELAIKQRQGLAWSTGDRALTAARASGNPVRIGEAARVVAIAMRHAGRYQAAIDLLTDTALSLDAGDGEPGTLAVCGSLLLTASYSAAQGSQRLNALHLAEEAEEAARRIQAADTRGRLVLADFSAQQCDLYRIGIHHALGEDPTALDYATRITLARLPSPERRARLCTDVARAWQGLGKPDRAFQALRAAEQHAPQEVRRPSLRFMAAELLHAPGNMPGLRSFAQRVGALPAY